MFPLPPNEAAVLAEIYRLLDVREVAPLEPRRITVGGNKGPSLGVVPEPASAEDSSPAADPQVGGAPLSLFDERRVA